MRKPCEVFTDREEKDATFCGATDLIDQAYRVLLRRWSTRSPVTVVGRSGPGSKYVAEGDRVFEIYDERRDRTSSER